EAIGNVFFDVSNADFTIRAPAEVTYTGATLAFTAMGASTASVLLRATVHGDVSDAALTFEKGRTALCGPLAIDSVGCGTGSASCSVSLGAGAHTIDARVSGSDSGSGSGVVVVAQPSGGYVAGGGTRTLTSSAGTYAADAGSTIDFGFSVRYGRTLR